MSGATVILIFEQLGAGKQLKRLIARIYLGARELCDVNTQARYTCAVAVNYGGY